MVTLNDVLDLRNLREAWKEVRDRFREDLVRDALLHLDYQHDLDKRLNELAAEVRSGRYRVLAPWFVKCGKGRGLFRIHTFLDVKDLVLLHGITRRIVGPILKKAPTRTAYFSRSQHRHGPTTPLPAGYPWLLQWKAFQRHILRFSKTYPFLVTTDISGYYDHIQHGLLRQVVLRLADASVEVVDLLFFILEDLTHRPQYIPNVFVGLPVIDYDAPRLLAHAFLFELDGTLFSQPGLEFTRWMDDYDVGVKSFQDAKRALSLITQSLRKYYLMPNAAKTRILRGSQLDSIFHFRENTWLSRRENRTKIAGMRGKNLPQVRTQLRRRFAEWIRTRPQGNWTQVLKRYYTLFGYVTDPGLIGRSRRDLREHPEVADHILRYYRAIGYRKRILDTIERYLDSADNIYEDIEIKLLEFLAEWPVPNRPVLKTRIANRALVRFRTSALDPSTDAARAVCVMLLAKYGTQIVQRRVHQELLIGRESNVLARKYLVAFSACLNLTDGGFARVLNVASGDAAAPVARVVQFYRNLARVETWPPRIKKAIACSEY
jgi:hypothetical protein